MVLVEVVWVAGCSFFSFLFLQYIYITHICHNIPINSVFFLSLLCCCCNNNLILQHFNLISRCLISQTDIHAESICYISLLVWIGCYVFLYPDGSVCRAKRCEVSLAVYEWFYITVEDAETISHTEIRTRFCVGVDAEDFPVTLTDSRALNLTKKQHAALAAGIFVPIYQPKHVSMVGLQILENVMYCVMHLQ